MVLEGKYEARLNVISHYKGLVYLKGRIKDTNISLLLDSGATNLFVNSSCAKRLELKTTPTKEAVKVAFAQGESLATYVVPRLSFEVQNTKLSEDFTMCDLNGVDFVLGNTFVDFYGVEITRRPKLDVVMMGVNGKPTTLNHI